MLASLFFEDDFLDNSRKINIVSNQKFDVFAVLFLSAVFEIEIFDQSYKEL